MTDKDKKQKYTYQDYYSWDDGDRWELINGAKEYWIVHPFEKTVLVYKQGQ